MRKQLKLSHAHIQMARELGIQAKNMQRLSNTHGSEWKLSLAQFIEDRYEKSFGKTRPDKVLSIEQISAKILQQKAERKKRKESRAWPEDEYQALIGAAKQAAQFHPKSGESAQSCNLEPSLNRDGEARPFEFGSQSEQDEVLLYLGRCQCGDNEWRGEGPALEIVVCHCHSCRQSSGAPLMAWIDFPASRLTWSKGQPATYASSKRMLRGFCARCGTTLYNQRPAGKTISLSLASMVGPDRVQPSRQVHHHKALSWLKLTITHPADDEGWEWAGWSDGYDDDDDIPF